MASFCHDLQARLDHVIKHLDTFSSRSDLSTYTLSRRQFLMTLATLPMASLGAKQQSDRQHLHLEELLPQCAASLTACWHLSGGTHLEILPPLVDSFLPSLLAVVKHAPAYRMVAADLVAQCYFLKTILSWHLQGLIQADLFCQQAMRFSHIANNPNLLLTALNQQALIRYYGKQFPQALEKSEEAVAFLQHPSPDHIFPIVKGRVSMYLAAIQAQQRQPQAEQTLEKARHAFTLQTEASEAVPLYADCGMAPLTLWEGLTHYHLSQQNTAHAEPALISLRTFGQLQSTLEIPERFRLECVTNRALAAIACQEMEEALLCLQAGEQGVTSLESHQRRAEMGYVAQQMLGRWPHEARLHHLKRWSEQGKYIH
jgi:hypothetical protein